MANLTDEQVAEFKVRRRPLEARAGRVQSGAQGGRGIMERGSCRAPPARWPIFDARFRRRLLACRPFLSLFDMSCFLLVGIQEISIFSVHKHAIRARSRSGRRSHEGDWMTRDTRPIDALDSLARPHRLFSLPTHRENRRPLPSSTRTATGPSRPRSWAPSCARWDRTRRRRSCR